jgi:hypothetical protein
MADHLSHQKLKKEYFAGPSVFYALEAHWHHQEWGRHAPRHHFIHRFLNVSLENVIFLPLACFFIPGNHVFRQFFHHFQRIFLTFWLGFVYHFFRHFLKVVLKKS